MDDETTSSPWKNGWTSPFPSIKRLLVFAVHEFLRILPPFSEIAFCHLCSSLRFFPEKKKKTFPKSARLDQDSLAFSVKVNNNFQTQIFGRWNLGRLSWRIILVDLDTWLMGSPFIYKPLRSSAIWKGVPQPDPDREFTSITMVVNHLLTKNASSK